MSGTSAITCNPDLLTVQAPACTRAHMYNSHAQLYMHIIKNNQKEKMKSLLWISNKFEKTTMIVLHATEQSQTDKCPQKILDFLSDLFF